jgi:hypothetical protein
LDVAVSLRNFPPFFFTPLRRGRNYFAFRMGPSTKMMTVGTPRPGVPTVIIFLSESKNDPRFHPRSIPRIKFRPLRRGVKKIGLFFREETATFNRSEAKGVWPF